MVYGLQNKKLLKIYKKWNESRKSDAVNTKVKIRQVLKSRSGDKTLLQFSADGIYFTLDELI
jgi:hypothetical protein